MTETPPEAPSPAGPAVSPEAAQAYLDKRVKPQREWFDKRAAESKTWHFRLAAAQMIATAAIPVVNVFVKSVMASTILAFAAAIATGFAQLWRHREHWERYRATAGALETLLIRYELRLPPYDGDDAPARVIEDADRLLGEEEAKWTSAIRSAKPAAVKTPFVPPPEEG
jgi:hypothetical protein